MNDILINRSRALAHELPRAVDARPFGLSRMAELRREWRIHCAGTVTGITPDTIKVSPA
jgi:hypothetical protein